MEILARAGAATGIILVCVSIYYLYNWRLKLRTPNLLAELSPKSPSTFTLVYFTTPTCIPCKTIQKPAIQNLIETLGSALHVIEIDATEKPDLASRWGVMSVPTTFLFNQNGQLHQVNHGVANTEKLLKQLDTIPKISPLT